MSNLSTKRHKSLSHQYNGSRIMVGKILYKPVKITAYETIPSRINRGKQLLVAQVIYLDQEGRQEQVLFTESYDLIRTLDDAGTPPHYGKIIKSRDGRYSFAPLSNSEIQNLKNI